MKKYAQLGLLLLRSAPGSFSVLLFTSSELKLFTQFYSYTSSSYASHVCPYFCLHGNGLRHYFYSCSPQVFSYTHTHTHTHIWNLDGRDLLLSRQLIVLVNNYPKANSLCIFSLFLGKKKTSMCGEVCSVQLLYMLKLVFHINMHILTYVT